MTTLLHRFTQRYRTALLTKTLVLAALGFALAGVLAWRLAALRAAPAWRVGVPAILAAATGAGLGWWLRRRWPSRRASAAHLDRLLGLKQRLITAEEFATVTAPPALYPLLVADASTWVADTRTRYPRPLDRTAAALLLLLLLALAWPLGGHSPLQQLAQLPKPTPPPPQQQQQNGSSQQPQQSSSGQNQQQQTGGGGSSSDSGAQQNSSGNGKQGAGQDAQSRSGQGQSQQDAGGRSGAQAGGQPKGGQDQGGSQQPSQSGQSQSGTGSASGQSQGGTQGAAQQARASAGGQSADQAQASAGGSQAAGSRSVEAKAASAQAGGRGSGSPGNEALQQEIQQLLKEVSGEIRTLQAQIAAAKGQPPPAPGTTTDPELYGAAEPPGQTDAGTVPIQLKTDAAATTGAARAASGVGRPSGEVAAASPTATAEPAQLSDEPLEEPAGSRETVPPEYRDVFDRLNRRSPSGI